ncbi:RNA polymerase, sigma-24 subunit, ECF subfamily [Hirschia baltica ATCC 49814]|uniref:RNA polymerase sigma factor n=2 Tax=Hirschia TaxID=2723 RepID=C6XIS1_HIRBI|nr:RNA polymerase, sigma-24 subunit, ECF subfamily [Hirschia baltica ATCC 49814]
MCDPNTKEVIRPSLSLVLAIMNTLNPIQKTDHRRLHIRRKPANSAIARRSGRMQVVREVGESQLVLEQERQILVERELSVNWSPDLLLVGQSKDRDAFSRLFDHFAPRVKSQMLKYGASNEMAEEIVQETFVLVWRKASQYSEDKAAVSTWIFTIARNKRIDLLRRQNRPEPDVNDPAFHPDPILTGDDVLTGKQRALAVQRAMEKLPQSQKEVLQRSYFSDETHIEIAESLKTPLGTVKSRMRLALSKLRALIDEDLGEGSI